MKRILWPFQKSKYEYFDSVRKEDRGEIITEKLLRSKNFAGKERITPVS